MIRYSITITALEALVDSAKPNWRARARKRTARFQQAGRYFEPPAPIWGEIKQVFMAIQCHKCAYCERQLGGAIEFDVEHFRPKNAVLTWPPSGIPEYSFSTGGDFPDGYYLLAYHLGNYAVACKPCNTNLKGSFFPIKGARIPGKESPSDLVIEKPLLIFPLGDQANDPQALIRFDGHVPVPVATNPTDYDCQRAQVTINFFDLIAREELLRERCRLIFGLFIALDGVVPDSYKARVVTVLTSPTHPHTNCARCFQQLFLADHQRAEALAHRALGYLESVHDAFLQR